MARESLLRGIVKPRLTAADTDDVSHVAAVESRAELEDFVEEKRERVAIGLRRRDRLITGASGAAFFVAAVLLAVLAGTSRMLPVAAAAVLIGSYAVASRS